MTITRREKQRIRTIAEIKETARQQMAERGAATLSLGAIARQMGMTTPALYRYYTNRDALITALIIDGYQALGDAMAAAEDVVESQDFNERLQALCFAARDWASAYPQAFALLYGTPLPHYHAPRELTVPIAVRIVLRFGRLFQEAHVAGVLQIPERYKQTSPAFGELIAQMAARFGGEWVTTASAVTTLLVWSRVKGVIWSMLQGHFPPGSAEAGKLFEIEVATICDELRLAGVKK